jgi:hypothetical protein
MRGALNISTEDAMNNFGQLMQAACHEILLTGVSNAAMTFFKRSSCLNWPMKTSVAKWNDLPIRSFKAIYCFSIPTKSTKSGILVSEVVETTEVSDDEADLRHPFASTGKLKSL